MKRVDLNSKIQLMKAAFYLCLTIFFLGSCQKEECSPSIKNIELEQSVTLCPGNSAILDSEDFKITFLNISEDSRCPTGATCIWEGRAVAQLLIESGNEMINDSISTLRNKEFLPPDTIVVFGRKIKLVDVSPYPEIGSSIDADDYRLTIKIE